MLNMLKNSRAAKVAAVFLSFILLIFSEGSATELTLCEVFNSCIAVESGFKSFFKQNDPNFKNVSLLLLTVKQVMALLEDGNLRESHIEKLNDLFLEGEIEFVYRTEDFKDLDGGEEKKYEIVSVFSEDSAEVMKIIFLEKSSFPRDPSLGDMGIDISQPNLRYFDLPRGRMYIILSQGGAENKGVETIFDMSTLALGEEKKENFPEVNEIPLDIGENVKEENIGFSGLKRTVIEFIALSFFFQFVGVLTFSSHSYFLFSVFAVLPYAYCVLHSLASFAVMSYAYGTGNRESISSTVTVEIPRGKTVKMIREPSEFHTLPRFVRFLIRGHELTHVLGFDDSIAYRFPILGYLFGIFEKNRMNEIVENEQKALDRIKKELRHRDPKVLTTAIWRAMDLGDRRIVPYVADVMNHGDSDVKKAAIRLFEEMKDRRSVKVLLDSLGDESADIRRSAANVLKLIGIERIFLLKALAKGMGSKSLDVKNFSLINLEAMGALKGGHFAFWCKALRDEDPELRRGVLEILDKIKGVKSILDKLETEHLRDKRKDVRIAAALILAEMKSAGSLSRLLEVSQRDNDPEVRYYSKKAVIRIDPDFPAVLSNLCLKLRKDDIATRKQVMAELERRKAGKDMLEFWKWTVNTENKALKIASALVLSELRLEDTASFIIPLTKDNDDEVKYYAKAALKRWAPGLTEMIPIWCEDLRSEDAGYRAHAMKQIEKLDSGKKYIQYWRKSVKGRRKELVISAMLLLAEIRDEDSFLDILRLTTVRDKEIRQNARTALKRMAPNRNEMVPIWCEELRSEDPAVRGEAMTRLEKLNAGKRHIDHWRGCLEDQRKDLRIAALLFLAELKDTASLPAMKKMTASSDREISKFAGIAIKRVFGAARYEHAVDTAGKIHKANLKLIPRISKERVICHIVDDSLVIPEQKRILYELDKTMRNKWYQEKIVRISGYDEADFMANLEIAKQKQKELYPGCDIEFSIACKSIQTLSKILDADNDAKAIAFEPSGEPAQVEGIILALRALYLKPEKALVNLQKVYEFLSGQKLSKEDMAINDIKTFLKKKIFVLPPIRLSDHGELARINRLIYENIRTAA